MHCIDQDGEERAKTIYSIPPITITHPNELAFTKLSIPLNMEEEDILDQLHVMTGNDSPVPDVIAEIPEESKPELDGIDYANNFILFVFTGKHNFGSSPSTNVTQIWQNDNIIYIQANFPKQTSMTVIPGFYYGNYTLSVSKDNMSQFGEIKLILLDQDGNQRATTIAEILPTSSAN